MTSKLQGKNRATTTARRKTQDIVVRFANPKGQEVGRLPQETAEFVSTLIDQKICYFEGVCVYAPEQIRTNENIYLQLHCYMLRDAFARKLQAVEDDNRTVDYFGPKETEDEKAIRLRQVSLVKLFNEIKLEPVKGTGKHARSGILQAAEIAEKAATEKPKEKEKEVQGTPTGSQDEEAEDGKELEQDQLDELYSSSPSIIPSCL